MTYITSIERRGREEGREEGLREGLLQAVAVGLEYKFGAVGLSLLPEINALPTAEQVQAVVDRLRTATSLDEVRAIYRTEGDT